jgi:hypothetical protein
MVAPKGNNKVYSQTKLSLQLKSDWSMDKGLSVQLRMLRESPLGKTEQWPQTWRQQAPDCYSIILGKIIASGLCF